MELHASQPTSTSLSVGDYLSGLGDTAPRALQQQPIGTAKPSSNASPQPIAVGVHSSDSIARLNEKCQSLALDRPEFVFRSSSQGQWSVKAMWFGEEVHETGPYSNKQQAKGMLCGRLLEILNIKEENGEVRNPRNVNKVKKTQVSLESPTNANAGGPPEIEEQFVNYVGQLVEFQRLTDSPQPTYSEFQLGIRYFCTLLLESPSLPSSPQTFGSEEKLFPSKKLARQHVAKESITFLKSLGVWKEASDPVGGIKKKKRKTMSQDQAVSGTNTSTTASTTTIDVTSYAARVQSLAVQLGLGSPIWQYTSSPAAPGMLSVACYFKNGGRHAGPIGETRHVLGKRKARDACARTVFSYLMRVKEQRLEFGKQVISEVGAADQSEEQAVHLLVNGVKEEDSTTAGDVSADEFQDAVEDMNVNAGGLRKTNI